MEKHLEAHTKEFTNNKKIESTHPVEGVMNSRATV